MANIFGAPKAGGPGGMDDARTVPTGDTVGSYNSYLDAQKAVDYLADQQFPVHMVSIVGNELKMVERVTGRLSYPRVALSGALSGMWFGLFVGVLLSFFAPSPGYFSILTSVLMGAAFFMLFGIVTYAMQRGKRDFTSTSQVVATNYDVIVSPDAAHEARRLLQQLPMNRSDAAYQQGGYQNQPYQQHQPYGQHDPYQQPGPYQSGPGQQGPGQQDPAQQGPARPSGWNDPFGQRQQGSPGQETDGSTPGNEPQAPSQQQQPQYDGGAQQQSPAPARKVRYPDLPDGRPQYGVRVPQNPEAHEPAAQPPAGQGAAGNGQEDPNADRPAGKDQQGTPRQ